MLTLGLRNIVRTRNMCGKLLPCAYSGTRLESKLLLFFGFSVCSHVYLLNYRSELAQIWRQDTDTIHDHNHIKKK